MNVRQTAMHLIEVTETEDRDALRVYVDGLPAPYQVAIQSLMYYGRELASSTSPADLREVHQRLSSDHANVAITEKRKELANYLRKALEAEPKDDFEWLLSNAL